MKQQVKEILLKQLQLLQQESEKGSSYPDDISAKSLAMVQIARIILDLCDADS